MLYIMGKIFGLPDWAVYLAGAGIGLFVIYKALTVGAVLGYDIGDVLGKCPMCNANPNSQACNACIQAAAKKEPNPFG